MRVHTCIRTHMLRHTCAEQRTALSGGSACPSRGCQLSDRYHSLPSEPSRQPCPGSCRVLSSTPLPTRHSQGTPPERHQSECLPVIWRDRHKNIHHPSRFKHENSPDSLERQMEGQVGSQELTDPDGTSSSKATLTQPATGPLPAGQHQMNLRGCRWRGSVQKTLESCPLLQGDKRECLPASEIGFQLK